MRVKGSAGSAYFFDMEGKVHDKSYVSILNNEAIAVQLAPNLPKIAPIARKNCIISFKKQSMSYTEPCYAKVHARTKMGSKILTPLVVALF